MGIKYCYAILLALKQIKLELKMKKVLIIGATGTIGKAIVAACTDRVTIATASLHHGDYQVDLSV